MSVCSKKEKWSEVSLCDEVNAAAPCSVEFTLKACFPDDKQQTYLAKGIPYRAHTPQGTIEGVLDGHGSVIIPDVGIGNVMIEVLPDLETELKASRQAIKAILSELIAQEKAEAKAIQANYNNANWLEKRGYDIKAAASGIGSFFEGVWDAIKGVGEAISAVREELGEYIRHPMNIPETFKEDVAVIKAKYKALEKFANEDLENYFLLMSDDKTQDIFTTFAGDYYDAQHYSEVIEGGSEAVTGIILTIITAGAGAAVAGGATASRLAMTASKLKAPIDKIIKALQQKTWFKKSKPVKKQSVQANEKAVVTETLRFNRTEAIKGHQDHHIISDKNKATKDHELLEKAGGNSITKKYGKKDVETYDSLQKRNNKIYLPEEADGHPTRSIHKGRHVDEVNKRLKRDMDYALDIGEQNNWSQEQYKKALDKIMRDERIKLRDGSRALNKNKRPWSE